MPATTSQGPILSIAMTTAPRRRPTIHGATASLRGAGFNEVLHLFAEPGTFDRLLQPRWGATLLHANTSTLGCYRNWRCALTYLVVQESTPWIMIVQDDAVWQPLSASALYAAIAARQDLRTGFLSPYVTKSDVPTNSVDGWNECRSGWNLCGALALCMKREVAQTLLDHPRFAQHTSNEHVDSVVAQSMIDLDLPSYVHVPSLVDHVGRTSTIGHDDVSPGLRGYRFGEK